VIQRVQVIIATGFGSGYAPFAPGTAGTVVAVALFIPLAPLAEQAPWLFLATLVGLTGIAVWAAQGADQHFDSHDNKKIVIDEILGYFVTLAWVPYDWKTALAAFILFRFFDILKPPPVNIIDKKLAGGWGVVLDDVMAGIYANLSLQLLLYLGVFELF
jgi:phosphatidylglycerophosphatase A